MFISTKLFYLYNYDTVFSCHLQTRPISIGSYQYESYLLCYTVCIFQQWNFTSIFIKTRIFKCKCFWPAWELCLSLTEFQWHLNIYSSDCHEIQQICIWSHTSSKILQLRQKNTTYRLHKHRKKRWKLDCSLLFYLNTHGSYFLL